MPLDAFLFLAFVSRFKSPIVVCANGAHRPLYHCLQRIGVYDSDVLVNMPAGIVL